VLLGLLARDRQALNRPTQVGRRSASCQADRLCRPSTGLPSDRLHEIIKEAVQVRSSYPAPQPAGLKPFLPGSLLLLSGGLAVLSAP
jgi:hypothetical protein